MRRKDRERPEAFAWEVLQKANFATLSMVTAEGLPYAVPVNMVVDSAYKVLYLHCAGEGMKWDILEKEPPVCVSAVSHMAVVPNGLTVSYDSAIVRGRAQVVQDEGERVKALLLLTETMDPRAVSQLNSFMDRLLDRTKVVKIVPEEVTGKQNPGV